VKVIQLLTASLRELGVVQAGEVLDASEAADALQVLNDMVDLWAAQRLTISEQRRSTWTLVADQASYTVGSGGDVDITRPTFIPKVSYLDSSSNEFPLGKFEDVAWQSIVDKDLSSGAPSSWYLEPTFPLSTLYLWPVTDVSGLSGVMYHGQPVAEFTSLTQDIALPSGWRMALIKSLAVMLGPSFDRETRNGLEQQAADAVSVIKRANYQAREFQVPTEFLVGGGGSGYDIRNG
jgi:hypothetical protein